jgi:methylmalonyl-CoA/ethylmalonyl-CoA epimerase
MSQMTLSLGRLGQIAMPVQDGERATAFYRDRLGLKFLFSAPPGLAFFDCDGVRLMLSAPEGPGASPRASTLYFSVPDIQTAHDALAARGVRFVDKPHIIARMPAYDLWMAFFRDSEGNLLAIMSEAPKG